MWGTLLLFILVIGGIYGGIFTPTEAAGIGAGGAFLLAFARGVRDLQSYYEVFVDSARTSAMLFTVLFGALIFSNFVNRAGLPDGLLNLVNSLKM